MVSIDHRGHQSPITNPPGDRRQETRNPGARGEAESAAAQQGDMKCDGAKSVIRSMVHSRHDVHTTTPVET